MVSAKTGPVISILGSILVIGFGILTTLMYVDLAERGIELAYIRLAFALGVGAAIIIGGILALRGRKFGNIIPLIVAVIAIVGLFVPIGEIGVYVTVPTPMIIDTPVNLFSTLFYIDIILMCLGGLLGLLAIFIERSESKKTQISTRKNDVLRKAEKLLFDYLRENKGKAFIAKSLHKRCIEDTNLDMSIAETEKILYDLHLLGTCRLDVKENVNYYFTS